MGGEGCGDAWGGATSSTLHLLADAALAYHDWWYRERDMHGVGVVVSTHPWETGMDSGAWVDALERVPTDRRRALRART